MRRYELMLILRPDLAEDRIQAAIDRATRSIIGSGGQIIKVSPWGRRRLAYAIGPHREGSYHIVVFDAPSEAIVELERNLHITEEVIRHLVTHVERPASARRLAATAGDLDDVDVAPPDDEDVVDDGERIDESETEAAPAAID
jgi:small subunit ribosomal protein S6